MSIKELAEAYPIDRVRLDKKRWLILQVLQERAELKMGKLDPGIARVSIMQLRFVMELEEINPDDDGAGYKEHLDRLIASQERRLREAKDARAEAAVDTESEAVNGSEQGKPTDNSEH